MDSSDNRRPATEEGLWADGEREAFAEQRAAALARANEALQATIEALSDGVDLDQIVPRVLGIAADIFSPISCAFLENDLTGRIFLRYWNVNGETLTPAQLIQLDPEKFALVRRLAEEFEASDDYLGMPTNAIGTVALDHVRGTSVPEFDRFAVQAGWDLELNIGVGAAGVRSSTLVIYRDRTRPFQTEEIALAESLAKQLGLALRFAQLAEEARQAAVSREREEAAKARLAELAGANEVLRKTLGRFAVSSDTESFLSAILEEIVRQIGADDAQLALYDEPTHTMRTAAGYIGREHVEFDFPSVIPASELGAFEILRSMRAPRFFDPATEAHLFWPGTADYHLRRGTKTIYCVSMLFGSRFSGFMGFGFQRLAELSPERAELVQALAQQATLVAELLRLSDTAQRAAVVLERERAERRRAVELAKANDALKRSLVALTENPDIDSFLGHVLRVITEDTGAVSSTLWTIDQENPYLETLHLVCEPDSITPGAFHALRGPEKVVDHRGNSDHLRVLKGEQFTMDVATHKRFKSGQREYLLAQGIATLLCVPVTLGDKALAAIVLNFADVRTFSAEQMQLTHALSHQAALAIELTRLASEARNAAVAEERERAAQQRALELTKGNEALQATADALATTQKISEMIPAVLRIISATFGSKATGYFEIVPDGYVILRFFLVGDSVFSAEELLQQPSLQKYEVPKILARGFIVDEQYFGEPFETRIRSTIVNHDAGTSVAAFDAWTRENNWAMELNVPLVAGSKPFGAVTLARETERPYTEVEIELAEALAKQLALAVQASRIASESESRAVAVARANEREVAAQNRAAELAKANHALSLSIVGFASKSEQTILERIFKVICDTTDAVSIAMQIADADVFELVSKGHPRIEIFPARPGLDAYLAGFKAQFTSIENCGALSTDEKQAFIQQGVRGQLTVPMRMEGELIGALMIRLRAGVQPEIALVELAQSLAHQATLALYMTKLASEARKEAAEKAASEERAALARELHDTLLQSFTGVTIQLRALGRRASLDQASRDHLESIEEQATRAVQEARFAVGGMRRIAGIDLASNLKHMVEFEQCGSDGEAAVVERSFTASGSPWRVPDRFAIELIRIVEEALRNANRHSQASRTQVVLRYGLGSVSIAIIDNGNGFDLAEALSMSDHFGIAGMEERARQIGANLHIDTRPGRGTSVRIELNKTPTSQEPSR